MLSRIRLIAVAGIVAFPPLTLAQGGRVTIHGVAYDSLHREPLGNASITIAGGVRNTKSDSLGRFQFDSVAPGVYTVIMHHAVLDSVGFGSMSSRATITDGRNETRIAIPSFATLWRAACGGSPPRDSGFVYGTIREASGLEPVENATVEVTWTDFVIDKKRYIVQRRWRLRTHSEAGGGYTICGVPSTPVLRIRATLDSSTSGLIDLPPRDDLVRRRDFLVGSPTEPEPSRRGTINGVVTDAAGQTFADARILMDEVPEVRSGADGRFTIRAVPAGTRQLEVRSVGLMPAMAVVDVIAGETVALLVNVGTPRLTAIHVTAPVPRRLAEEFELRRRRGGGYVMDSTDIARYTKFTNAFHDIPSVRPEYHGINFSVSVPSPRGGRCTPDVRIDGAEAGYGHLVDLFPDEVAALEVYPHVGTVPMQFVLPGKQSLCGIILVWTKYAFRGR